MRPHGCITISHLLANLGHFLGGPWAPSFQMGEQQFGRTVQGESNGPAALHTMGRQPIGYEITANWRMAITDQHQCISLTGI
jgi:hypothetical protein